MHKLAANFLVAVHLA